MNETRFKSKILQIFNSAGAPGAFIWKHDARFKSGFPDIYWRTPAFFRGSHWELKVYDGLILPKDLTQPHRDLATPLQIRLLKKLAASGARAAVVVLHEPPNAPQTITVAPLNKEATVKTYRYDDFWRWWGRVPNITYSTE